MGDALSEVEQFLLGLGLPRKVVDIFRDEECDDLSAFMYLRPEDPTGSGCPWPWRRPGLAAAAAATTLGPWSKRRRPPSSARCSPGWTRSRCRPTTRGRTLSPMTGGGSTSIPSARRRAGSGLQSRGENPGLTLMAVHRATEPVVESPKGHEGGGFDPDDFDAANLPLPQSRSGTTSYFDLASGDFDHEDPPEEAWAPPWTCPTRRSQPHCSTLQPETRGRWSRSATRTLTAFILTSVRNMRMVRPTTTRLGASRGDEPTISDQGKIFLHRLSHPKMVRLHDNDTGATEGPFSPDT